MNLQDVDGTLSAPAPSFSTALNSAVVDASVLREAQEHPDNYGTLSVRASVRSAGFVTLSHKWQDMVLEQVGHKK